jgi:F0F1-type ATP synthase assembly protein I
LKPLKHRISVASLGIEMALCVMFGLFLGQWWDERFQSALYGQAFFILVGIAAATKAVMRVAKEVKSQLDDDDDEKGGRPLGFVRFEERWR